LCRGNTIIKAGVSVGSSLRLSTVGQAGVGRVGTSPLYEAGMPHVVPLCGQCVWVVSPGAERAENPLLAA